MGGQWQPGPGLWPCTWRDSRLCHSLQTDEPCRWVGLAATETIASRNLNPGAEPEISTGLQGITLGTVAADNRRATTLIADRIHEQVLDGGSCGAGVEAYCASGGGLCWAYWLRRPDGGLGDDAASDVDGSAIDISGPDLDRVHDREGINAV